jgi:hypothetical protein
MTSDTYNLSVGVGSSPARGRPKYATTSIQRNTCEGLPSQITVKSISNYSDLQHAALVVATSHAVAKHYRAPPHHRQIRKKLHHPPSRSVKRVSSHRKLQPSSWVNTLKSSRSASSTDSAVRCRLTNSATHAAIDGWPTVLYGTASAPTSSDDGPALPLKWPRSAASPSQARAAPTQSHTPAARRSSHSQLAINFGLGADARQPQPRHRALQQADATTSGRSYQRSIHSGG